MSREAATDACVLINLLATGLAVEIARANNVKLVVPEEVAAEAFKVRDPDGSLRDVDLAELRDAGVLTVASLSGEEQVTFVDLVAEGLGDGEAATIAIGLSRGLEVATDDKRALRALAQRGIGSPVRTTMLLRTYCEVLQLSQEAVRDLLGGVRQRASFLPSVSDPDFEWWEKHESGDP
jgi:predicted nucleic acid-binding protein